MENTDDYAQGSRLVKNIQFRRLASYSSIPQPTRRIYAPRTSAWITDEYPEHPKSFCNDRGGLHSGRTRMSRPVAERIDLPEPSEVDTAEILRHSLRKV